MTRIVKIIPYNPDWPLIFSKEAGLIKKILGDNCLCIHHIGSTSVPDLPAKPIIDMIPVVKDIMVVDQMASAMEQHGYQAKGENGMLFRRFFQKTENGNAYNIHIYEEGNPEIERHVKFRDWMRTHENDRKAYAKLKIELAEKYPNDLLSYVFGKETFVADIDTKAGANGLRIVQALTNREWETIRNFRQKYFFDPASTLDPYTWTFEHKDHIHLVLYKGHTIIGYAHIQLWPNHRAALRIIVIDESYRGEGFGSQFLKLCERWLLQQGMKTIHTQSSPNAFQFYNVRGYIQMPFNDPDGYETDPRDIEMGKVLQRL
ncbi:MAG: GNAT family N-acetyltransferase [Proteobacteria bacterium]|nr:GNAT family N-acetyltransferase [Pseudomonadota bacterium]